MTNTRGDVCPSTDGSHPLDFLPSLSFLFGLSTNTRSGDNEVYQSDLGLVLIFPFLLRSHLSLRGEAWHIPIDVASVPFPTTVEDTCHCLGRQKPNLHPSLGPKRAASVPQPPPTLCMKMNGFPPPAHSSHPIPSIHPGCLPVAFARIFSLPHCMLQRPPPKHVSCLSSKLP